MIGFSKEGLLFVIGVVVVMIEVVLKYKLYIVGKLNLMMFCLVLNCIEVYFEIIVMIGD